MHPLVGKRVRGISENAPQQFDRTGIIKEVQEDVIHWVPDGMFLAYTSQSSDIEILPPLKEKSRLKRGKLSYADILECRIRFPELKKLAAKESLTDNHMALGAWSVYRDILRDQMPPKQMPHLLCSTVVHTFVHADPSDEEQQKQEKLAGDIIQGRWKMHGLLGFPIAGGYHHWTLLVLRRSLQETQIRYYDSLTMLHEECLEAAQKILKLLLPEHKVGARRNRTFQADGCSCGVFALHYWEGEVRQFCGQGWVVGRPTNKSIGQIRERITHFAQQVLDAPKDLELPGKTKKVLVEDTTDAGDLLDPAPAVPPSEQMMEHLKSAALKAASCGSVSFYGCSRCRYSRGGCISWNCNPEKFQAHMAKFPEKYSDKKLIAKITDKELVGEEF